MLQKRWMGQDARFGNKSTTFVGVTSSQPSQCLLFPQAIPLLYHIPSSPFWFAKDLISRFVGPHSQADLESFPRPFQSSRLSTVLKKTTSSRTINDLSFPALSLNNNSSIEPDAFITISSYFPHVRCTILLDGNPDTEVAAFDNESADHLIPSRPSPQTTTSEPN